MTINYREAYGIFGISGILFNHESPLRGKEFVTRKITDAVARVNPQFYRPVEVDVLIGSAQKAHDMLGWKATTHLEALCQLMVEADLERVKSGKSF